MDQALTSHDIAGNIYALLEIRDLLAFGRASKRAMMSVLRHLYSEIPAQDPLIELLPVRIWLRLLKSRHMCYLCHLRGAFIVGRFCNRCVPCFECGKYRQKCEMVKLNISLLPKDAYACRQSCSNAIFGTCAETCE